MKLRKAIAAALVAASLCANVSAVDLFIDTKKIDTDTPPTIVDGRTLVPVAAIFRSLGATVEWNGETRTATGYKDDITIEIPIDSKIVYVNGEAKELDVPAQIINNRTMVPARFVSEALDCVVTWSGETSTAAVAYELKEQKFYVTKSGKRYHFQETCNGGTYYESTLADAMGRGLTPCDKCVLKIGN